MSVSGEPRWVKIGQIASDLGVGDHVVRHYTEKLKDVLGENIQLDPNNKHTLYNEEAVRILTLTRKMVSEDKLTLAQVEAQLKRAAKSNVPMASKTQIDILNAYSQVLNRLDGMEQRFGRFEGAFEAVAERLRVLDNIEHLPLAIASLQDDLQGMDVKALLNELSDEKASVEAVRQTNEELLKKLEEAELREKELRETMEKRESEFKETFEKGLDSVVNRMLEEGERRWATPAKPEVKKGFLGRLFGKD